MKAKQARNNSGSAKSKLRSRSALFLQDIKKSAVKDQFECVGVIQIFRHPFLTVIAK